MIPKNTAKIVLFLLKHIDTLGYNINRLAKLNSISVGSAFKILKTLEKNSIVLKRNISNASHYTLNLQNPETVKLCELLLLIEKRNLKGRAKQYVETIGTFEHAELILLSAPERKHSATLLFVTHRPREVRNFCLDIRTATPLILKKADLIKELNRKNLLDIIAKSVVLKGEDVFVDIVKSAYLCEN